MSVVVGTLSVDLVARTAAFQGDLGKAAQGARGSFNDIKKSAKEAGDGVSSNMHEARASLALLGEEVGIRVPRHLRNFIIQLPGVGTALNAAFNSVAVVALIGLLVEAGKKLYEFSQQAQKAYEKIRDESEKTIEQAQRQARALDLAMLAPAQRAKAQMAAAETQSQQAWKEVERLTQKLDELRAKRTRDPMRPDRMVRMYGEDSPEVKGLIVQIDTQIALYNQYRSEVSKSQHDLTEELKKEEQKRTKDVESELDKRAAAQKKLEEIMAGVNRLPASGRTNVGSLAPKFGDNDIDPTGIFRTPGMKGAGNGQGIYGGTAEAEKLYKIQHDQNEALKEAQKVYTEIRTPMQQYVDQMAILGELLAQGKIDQDQFNAAEKQAHKVLGDNQKMWGQLGQDIGETIKAAALFGRSWTDALKAMAVELIQVILQMTVLKKLKDSMSGSGGGGGGFLGSLMGGLFGGFHAEGGTIPAGTYGIAGEAGPEVIYGGVTGVTVFPTVSGGSGGVTVINQIDARGADPSVLPRMERALKESENRTYARTLAAVHEQRRRTGIWR